MKENRNKHTLQISYRYWERFRNTFLQVPFLWNLIIDYPEFQSGTRSGKLKRCILRIFWFWPRLYEAEEWRDGSVKGNRDPRQYVDFDPGSYVLMDEVTSCVPDRKAEILDLGSNCGRYLNYLVKAGYDNLYGVDISDKAFEYMNQCFPGLKEKINFSCSTFQEYLSSTPSEKFEAVFTHGATVELVHPSYPLVKQIARVTRSFVIFLIQEYGHRYPRFWEWEFKREGFLLRKLLRPAVKDTLVSLMVFERCNRNASRS